MNRLLDPMVFFTEDVLDELVGIAGVGWTVSILGYLVSAVGTGVGVVANPQSLLYLGGLLFVATVGLDRLRTTVSAETD